jgi:pimeloyl-ACP methyl ester carboxylesterase
MIFEKQIVNMYKGMMHTRCDDTETVFYFSEKGFPGLKKEAISFTASAGHTLKGYLYQYDGAKEDKLIVFDHGFGGGHRAYMKEIVKLCLGGYKVFSYDHTGCMESGGVTPNGLAQSLCDLNDCISMLKNDERFSALDISVMGHSWGAFSTMNIAALHPEISHVVAMSGFVSVPVMVSTFFAGPLKGYRQAILDLEMRSNPVYALFNSVESLKTSGVKALLIYSDNDTICKPCHYEILKQGLEDVPTVKFLVAKNKGHNPNYTEDAATYAASFGKARAKFARKKKATDQKKADFVASYDWDRMTEQDESVWQVIFEHLES